MQCHREAELKELGYSLPEVPVPAGEYVPYKRVGNLLYCSGVLPMRDGGISHTGAVGADQNEESACEAAEICALNAMAIIKLAAGSLDAVSQIVFVNGFVNGVAGFSASPQVINGASRLFGSVFGEAGKHARAAVTVAGLPGNATVEIQVVAELGMD